MKTDVLDLWQIHNVKGPDVEDIDRIFADDGCTDSTIEKFDAYIKVKGQALLEEIDTWFATNASAVTKEERKDTGLYMVHYVETAEERRSLREVLQDRLSEAKR